ncbi:MAG: aromatic ring-hydroxylating dioxygenase subunit alpha [Maricaulaceae bacterium]
MIEPLSNLWHVVGLSKAFKPGRLVETQLAGRSLAMGRTREGAMFAFLNACPHRGARLSDGRLRDLGEEGPTVECPYHGWRFRTQDGVCAAAPSVPADQDFDVGRIQARRWPVCERDGVVWVAPQLDLRAAAAPSSAPPGVGAKALGAPKLAVSVDVAASWDQAACGFVDPAHGPYVHRQWFWRSSNTLRDKAKQYEPLPLGFTMAPHRPSSNSRLYYVFGADPVCEIRFELPAVRYEIFQAPRFAFIALTAVTPLEANRSRMTQVFWWSAPWFSLFKPALAAFTRRFLAQDGAVLAGQAALADQAGAPIYARDADRPIQWFYALARDWSAAQAEGRPLRNPVEPCTLRWRT